MPRQVAILHGWSDTSESFKPLAKFLKQNGYATQPIFLGDYISLRDDVTIDDVAKRMEEVIREKMDRPTDARDHLDASFDLIVHSTGGLVARRWISKYYGARSCPVHNLIMLAPANFGSRLAHLGRSMLGRIFKGWRTGLETGDKMLRALELGSSFQWDLATADLFIPPGAATADAPVLYAPDRVRPFVIVGTHPYTELSAKLTNENGSDGTVRVAAANMNAYGITVDFSGDPQHLLQPEVTPWAKRGGGEQRFPLAVLPDRTHGNIILPDDPGLAKTAELQAQLGKLILQALQTNTAQQYDKAVQDWRGVCMETRTYAGASDDAQRQRDLAFTRQGTPAEYFHEYYQIVVRAEDEFGAAIPDYFASFMSARKQGWFNFGSDMPKSTVFFHDEVMEDTHVNEQSSAQRCFYLDRFDLMRKDGFYDQLTARQPKELAFSVTAADPGERIAYFSRSSALKRGLVKVHQQEVDPESANEVRWLKRHSTHFVRIVVPRAADPGIFSLKRG